MSRHNVLDIDTHRPPVAPVASEPTPPVSEAVPLIITDTTNPQPWTCTSAVAKLANGQRQITLTFDAPPAADTPRREDVLAGLFADFYSVVSEAPDWKRWLELHADKRRLQLEADELKHALDRINLARRRIEVELPADATAQMVRLQEERAALDVKLWKNETETHATERLILTAGLKVKGMAEQMAYQHRHKITNVYTSAHGKFVEQLGSLLCVALDGLSDLEIRRMHLGTKGAAGLASQDEEAPAMAHSAMLRALELPPVAAVSILQAAAAGGTIASSLLGGAALVGGKGEAGEFVPNTGGVV